MEILRGHAELFYAEKIGLKPKSSTLNGETVLILLSHLLTVNVSNEGYYRNRSCALRYLRFYYSSCITYFVYLVQLNYLWTNFSCCLWREGEGEGEGGGIVPRLRKLYLFTHSGVQHILCCVFFVFFVYVLCAICFFLSVF